ncbi:MAG: bile acid:sodium symporter family protein [Opitutales bacterium]|nr:bile acid:sodium symporter family protein [Opitutales bacterium]
MTRFFTISFPVWAVLFSALAYFKPEIFNQQRSFIVPLLSMVMLGMGLTLKPEDFLRVLKKPLHIGIGMALQYGVMPLAAFVVSKAFGLSNELMIGMVLVGASAGGTASNVIAYLAGASVPLSISLTLTSTIMAVFMLPVLTWLYIGQVVAVPVLGMMKSVFLIVIFPISIGLLLNAKFGKRMDHVKQFSPVVSVIGLVWIISIVVALNAETLNQVGVTLGIAVALHNAIGLTAGYFVAWFITKDRLVSRTIAIEVGMQNSGLSVALANQFFTAISALPGALFSVWHNITGSLLAAWFSKNKKD